jgi:histidinol-phosphate aminotransferase
MSMNLTRRSLLGASPLIAASAAFGSLPRLALAQPAAATAPAAAASLRLAGNENPYGPSERTRQAIRDTLPDAWKYAIVEEMQLRKLIAEREGLTPQHVMIGDGSTEILRIAALANGLDHGEVITAATTFSQVADYSRELKVPVQEVPLDAELRYDLAAIRGKFSPATRLVYICNPNNPTASRLTGAQLRDFVAKAPKEILVVVDEAYLDLSDDVAEYTVLPRVLAGDNVIVTRTFSKLHGMAGLRIGYGLARPDIIARLEKLRITMLNIVSLKAAIASYQDTEFQAFSRARIQEGRTITVAMLDELGLRHTDSHANFVFFDTKRPFAEFSQAMRQQNIHIGRPFAPYTTWARVSMGTVEQMRTFAAAARAHFRPA